MPKVAENKAGMVNSVWNRRGRVEQIVRPNLQRAGPKPSCVRLRSHMVFGVRREMSMTTQEQAER